MTTKYNWTAVRLRVGTSTPTGRSRLAALLRWREGEAKWVATVGETAVTPRQVDWAGFDEIGALQAKARSSGPSGPPRTDADHRAEGALVLHSLVVPQPLAGRVAEVLGTVPVRGALSALVRRGLELACEEHAAGKTKATGS